MASSTTSATPPRPPRKAAAQAARKTRAEAARLERKARTDGAVTRAGLVETAGALFAERGYADTTGKAICERAGVNMAAVNYHFGSRDGLYLEVLREVHQRIVSLAFLRELARSGLPPEEKLRAFLRELMGHVLADAGNWPMRVWARELLAPSPLWEQFVREEAQPKFELLSAVVSEITGVLPGDARLPALVLGVIAPCLMLLVAGRERATPVQPLFRQDAAVLAEQFWIFALGGLRAAVARPPVA
ncbi:TetR/AcrR family transcriptional regulator [Azohydromonas lata]|uniref:TetR/AcrR family transcriptional regulator n=1 Tax=Azohydromonas lata TaxID=45677 RepID=A0ABU5ILR1_9BURK|nr:TetR/AcrR family transcriptional regulator [Azohydromonas lata]MDZ5459817.1 TetR/AcrR family transcriptional regulator [Azohydromonas lata]